jgi:hypothetical protein
MASIYLKFEVLFSANSNSNSASSRAVEPDRDGECPMYFVAAVLAVLAGLFYAAGNHEIGGWGVEVCRYGSTFCDSPVYVLVGAILAALWGGFVSVR